jgi:hypothetical protein
MTTTSSFVARSFNAIAILGSNSNAALWPRCNLPAAPSAKRITIGSKLSKNKDVCADSDSVPNARPNIPSTPMLS